MVGENKYNNSVFSRIVERRNGCREDLPLAEKFIFKDHSCRIMGRFFRTSLRTYIYSASAASLEGQWKLVQNCD